MRKMKTPEMDVVRFKESDVIVASGGVPAGVMTLTGYSDFTQGNGKMSFGGKDYSSEYIIYNTADFVNAVQKSYPGAGNVMYLKNASQEESARNFAWDDYYSGMPIDDADGDYEFNNGVFTKTS